jgi:putative flippase GtrA
MGINEFELRDRSAEQRAKLAQRMVKVGMVFALGLMGLCAVVVAPVVMITLSEAASSQMPPLIVVSVVVPLAGIGLLAGALYKLIPLFIQYRQTRQQDEDMFP